MQQTQAIGMPTSHGACLFAPSRPGKWRSSRRWRLSKAIFPLKHILSHIVGPTSTMKTNEPPGQVRQGRSALQAAMRNSQTRLAEAHSNLRCVKHIPLPAAYKCLMQSLSSALLATWPRTRITLLKAISCNLLAMHAHIGSCRLQK